MRTVPIVSAAAVIALGFAGSASALTSKECSVKYQAAKSAGTLGTMKWNDFRKAECGAEASAAPASSTTAAPAAPPATNPLNPAPRPTAAARPAPAPVVPAPSAAPAAPTGPAVFPSAISAKYSTEASGKQRMHTCLDQYRSNEATGGNGGLKWIQKGGGYYSECNKHLKI